MKKILTAAVALLFTASFVQAQSDVATPQPAAVSPAPQSGGVKAPPAKCDMKNCVMMKGGKMVMLHDGKEMLMDSEMKTTDGTVIQKDGTVITADGKKSMMKNGECMDMSGKRARVETPPAKASDPATPSAK